MSEDHHRPNKKPRPNNNNTNNNNIFFMADNPTELSRDLRSSEGAASPDERLPPPPGVMEFLEDPTAFHPGEDFVNNTLLEDETLLTHTIKNQQINAVRVLLNCGADPNLPNRKGITPISVAAHKGNVAIMKMLIDRGALVSAVNISGSTALIQAAHFGHLAAVEMLLAHGAFADFANIKGTTALMRACQEGHADIAKALLAAQVDVNRKNNEGMNALMLASQRGHAGIVFELIKAGAAMDEQTAQGSTALMLACKRGHEKCAEVLVSMGAEIYMRDLRSRTARDTALKRNHTGLLCWLDTQVQIRRIQEIQHQRRSSVISELREAYLRNKLRLVPTERFVQRLLHATKVVIYYPHLNPTAPEGITTLTHSSSPPPLIRSWIPSSEQYMEASKLLEDFSRSSSSLPFVSKSPDHLLSELEDLVCHRKGKTSSNNIFAVQSPLFANVLPAKHVPNFADWQWPILFYKCLGLPEGVFDLIMDFMPLPRVWHWSLVKLQRRCRLAAGPAINDISILIDEILCDSLILGGKDQKQLQMKLLRSPHLHSYLVDELGMPESLLESLCLWADTQSLQSRCSSSEVTFRWPWARRMLSVAVDLYKWYKQRVSAVKWLQLFPPQRESTHDGNERHNLLSSGHREHGDDPEGEEVLAGTDAGGEEGSDGELDMDQPNEPETETELPVEAEVDELLDDSDNE